MPRGSRSKKRSSQEPEPESSSSSSSSSSEESSSEDEYDEEVDEEEEYEEGEEEGEWEDDEYGEETLETLMDAVMEYEDSEEGWETVREWLRTHSIEETQEMAETKGEYDTTALHVACRNEPPVDIVDILLMAAPDMIFWADSFGWLPLHYACANAASVDVVRILAEANPDGKVTVDKRGRTPLHFALGNAESPPTTEQVKLLCDTKNVDGAAKWPDENEMLPIHYACAYGSTVEILECLVDAWEESTTEVDSKGRTALHFAMGNADRPNSPDVVGLLVKRAPKTINANDAEDKLPIHLLSTKAEHVDEDKEEERDLIKECLCLYLSANPRASIPFLTGVLSMPEWIRDAAVLSPIVQTMLNSKISSRFPTMILLLDFYFLAGIIGAFSVTSIESIDRRYNDLNETNADRAVSIALLSPLYIGALYFLLREIVQSISVRAQTTFFSYICDPENMLNLSFVFLTIYFSIMMQTGLGDDARFRTGAAFTLCLCWLQVLAYFKSIIVDFAIFVSSTIFIIQRVVAFVVIILITIMAFAQMWYTLFRQTEECLDFFAAEAGDDNDDASLVDDFVVTEVDTCEPEKNYPFCESLYWSFFRTYTMMLGEIDTSQFPFDTLAMVLYAIFAFSIVILLLNILIAIITDLYGIITDERAAIVFWSNRLSFITEMELVTGGPWKNKVKQLFGMNSEDDDEDKVKISMERVAWKKLIEVFDPEVDNKSGPGIFLYVPLRMFISLFLIPFWLFLGIMSAGWLWPPQVREGIFVQTVHTEEEEETDNAECLEHLQEDLDKCKAELVEDFSVDRKRVEELKLQVMGIKKELKGEMKNIKEVMTSLFEVQQQALLARG